MRQRQFGLIFVMGTLFDKLRIYLEKTNQTSQQRGNSGPNEENDKRKDVDKNSTNEQVKTSNTTKPIKRKPRPTMEEMREAQEKLKMLEEELSNHKILMNEHQEKMMMLEQLIKRQCLVLKQNDDTYSYEQLARNSQETKSLWERIDAQLSSMIDKKTHDNVSYDEASLVKIKNQFDEQSLQLQEQRQCIKKHEEQFEDQLARIEMMREILDESSNHVGKENTVRSILDDHEKRLTVLEDRMAVYEKQVEKRLTEQRQLLVFTWLGLITTFVLCFAIVCSCCWFQ